MLEIKLAKSKMENEEGMNHLHIRVKPEETNEKINKPIAFFLVIDTSSSMNGPAGNTINHYSMNYRNQSPFINNGFHVGNHFESTSKLAYMKQAGERLIDMMKDGDMLGVVSFSEIARREFDLTTLNKEERYKAKDRIRALHASGMTNVSDGLETAYKQIPKGLTETHHVKLILLSDGEANYGITNDDGIATLVSGYRKNDVSVSTIGVGLDYNSYFMETIATASGGMFYHLENMEQLNDILTKELETLTTLNTKQAKVVITNPEDIELSSNLNGFTEERKGEIYLGNIFNDLDIVVEVFTENEIQTGKRTLTIRYEYINAKGVKHMTEQEVILQVVEEDDMDDVEVNKEVVELVKTLLEAKTKKDSLRYYEAGSIEVLQSNLSHSLNHISKASESYGFDATDMVDDMKNLENSMITRSLDKTATKSMYANSYSIMNNQSSDKRKE